MRTVKMPEGKPDQNFPFEGNYGHLEQCSEGWIFKYQAGGLFDPLLRVAISDEDATALIAGALSEEYLVKRLEAQQHSCDKRLILKPGSDRGTAI